MRRFDLPPSTEASDERIAACPTSFFFLSRRALADPGPLFLQSPAARKFCERYLWT